MEFILKVFLLPLYILSSVQSNYYWREYNGIIPSDSFKCGEGLKGNPIYTGQAYVNNQGLFAGELFCGSQEIAVCANGVKKITNIIKILCSNTPSKLYWIPTRPDTFFRDIYNKKLVIGTNKVSLNQTGQIGRIKIGGIQRIAQICADCPKFELVYVEGFAQKSYSGSFEVLAYD